MAARRDVEFESWVRGFFEGVDVDTSQIAVSLKKNHSNYLRQLDAAADDNRVCWALAWKSGIAYYKLLERELAGDTGVTA